LLVALDDATGTILAALFRGQEDTHGYLLLLRQLVATHGCPLALYHDRHGIFQKIYHPPGSFCRECRRGRSDSRQ
jgi:hypothetical protein